MARSLVVAALILGASLVAAAYLRGPGRWETEAAPTAAAPPHPFEDADFAAALDKRRRFGKSNNFGVHQIHKLAEDSRRLDKAIEVLSHLSDQVQQMERDLEVLRREAIDRHNE